MSAGIRAVPGAGADIAGVLPGEPAVTVLSVLGGGTHVLILELADLTFGLLVGTVTGLCLVDPGEIRAVVSAAHSTVVSGTVQAGGALAFVADPRALAARL
ncbi:hypothetical protein JF66_09830 [Cryobacterium sp. MLB-32]|uniref:chemotaxis protein CheW n=1 Tax=Cryobacterium sp. MLB-32 TaxID=1529318 RepID=UPI0004E6E1AF|nr:hypothetical protein JF66_09830 [Cryobacterium sp. MLB-32]